MCWTSSFFPVCFSEISQPVSPVAMTFVTGSHDVLYSFYFLILNVLLMKKTSFRSVHFGTGAFLKALFSGMVVMLLIGVQGVQAQVSSTLQANTAGGSFGVDAVVNAAGGKATSQASAQALLNADLLSQTEATTSIRTTAGDLLNAVQAQQQGNGNLTPAQFAAHQVQIAYYSYLYDQLLKGADLYSLMGDSYAYLVGLVAQQNPAHGLSAADLYQEALLLVSID